MKLKQESASESHSTHYHTTALCACIIHKITKQNIGFCIVKQAQTNLV